MKRKSADSSLAPGFRFHPTDEELVRYYLKRKVAHKPLRVDPISEIDIYKAEPWDLPGKSRLKTRDLEWYFFCSLDRKYGNGSKTNRATGKGYWKTTGKDRPVRNGSRIVGMKKTLVYHCGRAPRGDRTNWVMHEYRLIDDELEKAGISPDAFVLCRIFQKSGPGPKNGEKYGAPFVEEEWEDDFYDEMTPSPEQEVFAGEVLQGDAPKFDANELNQDAMLLNRFCNRGTSNSSEHKEALVEEKSEAQISFSEAQMQQQDVPNLVDLPVQQQMNFAPVEPEEDILSPDELNGLNLNDLLDETFVDASDNLVLGDTPYLQTDNPSSSAETNPTDFNLDEFLNFYDAEDNIFMDKDSSQMMLGVDDYCFDGSLFAPNISNPTANAYLLPEATQDFALPQDYLGSAFNPQTEADWINSDIDSKLSEYTNFWENLPCPSAYASELPSKDALVQLSSMSPTSKASSTSAHSTAAMLRIRDITLSSKGVDLSFGKNGKFNLVLSFQMAEDVPSSGATTTSVSTTPSSSWSWLSCLFLWAIFIPVTCKLASFMRAG